MIRRLLARLLLGDLRQSAMFDAKLAMEAVDACLAEYREAGTDVYRVSDPANTPTCDSGQIEVVVVQDAA